MPPTEYENSGEKAAPGDKIAGAEKFAPAPSNPGETTVVPRTPAETAAAMKALGHETRIEILTILHFSPATVSDLAVALDTPQSSISKHLKTLAQTGLIECSINGRDHIYMLVDQHIGNFVAELTGELNATPFLETLPSDHAELPPDRAE